MQGHTWNSGTLGIGSVTQTSPQTISLLVAVYEMDDPNKQLLPAILLTLISVTLLFFVIIAIIILMINGST